ncbi:MAG: amidohydrolase family protein [Solirubrobacteraceae bacterium]|jgi:hypothetical protein|nr:amidohydrolase family protein [Solirubrobacteraceae bacterium]
MKLPVIDMWSPIVPAAEIIDELQAGFPVEQLSYLEVFTGRSVSAEEFSAYAETLRRSDDQLIADLDEAGITRSLITGFDERSTCGVTFVANEAVAALGERHPERFVCFAGADIMRGSAALAELEHWVGERGFRGLSLRPFLIGEVATHRAYFPFYAKCVELDIPLSIHASANWTRTRRSELGHPRFIDEVACHFPELRIIMSHAGYPWVLEACLIARKHPNVYLELSAHRPRYFTAPGAGWEPLLRFGATTIREQVLFGTGAFLINRPYAELCDEARALPLAPEVLRLWLHDNAARLLG